MRVPGTGTVTFDTFASRLLSLARLYVAPGRYRQRHATGITACSLKHINWWSCGGATVVLSGQLGPDVMMTLAIGTWRAPVMMMVIIGEVGGGNRRF
jgi:hypothetical protein